MAGTIKELIEWLKEFSDDYNVGIDEGGLTLRIVEDMDFYFEIGGIDQEIEDAWNNEKS